MSSPETRPDGIVVPSRKIVEFGAIPKTLEMLGIMQGHDIQHSPMKDGRLMPADEFFARADELVEKAGPIVLNEVIPQLENYPGRWNPGRFMVFPLGVHELGSLRFHVYPQGVEPEEWQGPFIHNHAWHLYSRVLIGRYSDTFFDLQDHGVITDPDFRPGEKGLIRLFETRRNPGGRDELVTDGTVVRAVPLIDRIATAGQHHTIEADTVYHIPTVSSEQVAATLVLDSPAIATTTRVLMDKNQPRIERHRREVSIEEALRVKEQLLEALK